ncbi:hypothetical protein PoB_000824900 [Plakobranchus ocellatus]|uniref:Uncharacterized protein n=1 Tax=Plakobranchus ocellatus TaxID=259542 RepID=A0AAV3YIA4_9GAST|nr:hypothetical protein PoB_000824900 [Plakobranchus ocellatus]
MERRREAGWTTGSQLGYFPSLDTFWRVSSRDIRFVSAVTGFLFSDIRTGDSSECPQQGDVMLSGPPSGQGTAGRAQTRDRRIPADVRADSSFLQTNSSC